MRKNDYREILSEKFKTASQLQTGPLSEEDEEYLRILAEARAVHAVKKAEREAAQRAAKEALQKRMTTSLAAVVLLAALLTGSYILGLNTDIRASADPDDEIKVVQQGDNIIIGPGVSENDENVGVVTYTYTNE